MPDQRPDAGEVALAGAPGDGGVEAESGNRELQPVFGILLDEVGDLVSGEVRRDDVRPSLADLQEVGAEVGRVGGNEFLADELPAVLADELLRHLEQVMPE